MKKILSVMILFVLIVSLVGCGGEESKITLENYEKISIGMTYEEVVEILGEGVQEVKTEDANLGLVIEGYRWQNSDGSNIGIMFNNGKIDTKAQAGLE